MNKYKLVPYLVLSKEDAKLENMEEELAKLLQDPSIDITLKRALYEDLLQRINRFKEDTQKSATTAVSGTPPSITPAINVQPSAPVFTAPSAKAPTSPLPPPTTPHAEPSDESVSVTQASSVTATPSVSRSKSAKKDPKSKSKSAKSVSRKQIASNNDDDRANADIADNEYADDDMGGFQSPKFDLKKQKRKRKGTDVTPKSQLSKSKTRKGTSFADSSLEANRQIGRLSDWSHTGSRDRRPSIVQHPQRWK